MAPVQFSNEREIKVPIGFLLNPIGSFIYYYVFRFHFESRFSYTHEMRFLCAWTWIHVPTAHNVHQRTWNINAHEISTYMNYQRTWKSVQCTHVHEIMYSAEYKSVRVIAHSTHLSPCIYIVNTRYFLPLYSPLYLPLLIAFTFSLYFLLFNFSLFQMILQQ